jgi:hypothetical protein
MNLKAKRHLEEQKKKIQENLAARIALLKENGVEPKQLAKDAQVRKLRADIRKAGLRLRSVAASEQVNSQKVVKKQEKEAAREAAKNEPAAKKKKAKPVTEKKEKKAKVKAEAPAEK